MTGRVRMGLCSNWVNSIYDTIDKTDLSVRCEIRKGLFPPNLRLSDSVLMIATGTGVAPIRSLLLERYSYCSDNKIGRNVLFFGSRNKDKDYLYSDDYKLFENNPNFNFKIFSAFSRDQEDKIYVQTLMRENKSIIEEMIFEEKCHILLVGNSKVLPKSVNKILVDVVKARNGCEEVEAVKYLNYMKSVGRYFIESW